MADEVSDRVKRDDPVLISIVTPSYNQAAFLAATMDSVLDQRYPALEYIVMDGGSTDGSDRIIRGYSERLAHWTTGPDGGQADAIQKGFLRSSGEVLGWVNSDDLLLPGALERVGRYFAVHPEIDCVVGGGVLIDQDDRRLDIYRGRPGFNLGTRQTFRKLLFWEAGGFFQPASFWRREAFFRVGGLDTSLRFCFDRDLYLRLAREKPFGVIPEFLACFRIHPDSKTSTMADVRERERRIVLDRHGFGNTSPAVRYLIRRSFVLADSARKRSLLIRRSLGTIRLPDIPPPPSDRSVGGRT